MKFIERYLIIQLISFCFVLSCPNNCSNQGQCLSGSSQICECFPGFIGIDCSQRLCPAGKAWVDYPYGNNLAHANYTECSNMGNCNRATGRCECRSGFTGPSCDQMKCPLGPNSKYCSGNGQCMSLREVGHHRDYIKYFNDVSYVGWDADMVHGCVCEDGWEGIDCSRRSCPSGDDPLTPGWDAIQILDCQLDSTYEITPGHGISFSFKGKSTPYLSPKTSIQELEFRLNQLPSIGRVILRSRALYSSSSSSSSSLSDDIFNTMSSDSGLIRESICSLEGSVTEISFVSPIGPQPPIKITLSTRSTLLDSTSSSRFSSLSLTSSSTSFVLPSSIDSLISSSTHSSEIVSFQGYIDMKVHPDWPSIFNPSVYPVPGNRESLICSNHGKCIKSTGTCSCEPGFISSNGKGEIGNKGDCGYYDLSTSSSTTTTSSSYTCPSKWISFIKLKKEEKKKLLKKLIQDYKHYYGGINNNDGDFFSQNNSFVTPSDDIYYNDDGGLESTPVDTRNISFISAILTDDEIDLFIDSFHSLDLLKTYQNEKDIYSNSMKVFQISIDLSHQLEAIRVAERDQGAMMICSGHGSCVSSSLGPMYCECQSGYGGSSCEKKTCPMGFQWFGEMGGEGLEGREFHRNQGRWGWVEGMVIDGDIQYGLSRESLLTSSSSSGTIYTTTTTTTSMASGENINQIIVLEGKEGIIGRGLAVCGGIGECDEEEGICRNCGGGWGVFGGEACDHLLCPNDEYGRECNGNGLCLSLSQLATLSLNDQGERAGYRYHRPWDAKLIHGCSCDSLTPGDYPYKFPPRQPNQPIIHPSDLLPTSSEIHYQSTPESSSSISGDLSAWFQITSQVYRSTSLLALGDSEINKANLARFYRGPFGKTYTDFKGYNCQLKACPSGNDPTGGILNEIQSIRFYFNNTFNITHYFLALQQTYPDEIPTYYHFVAHLNKMNLFWMSPEVDLFFDPDLLKDLSLLFHHQTDDYINELSSSTATLSNNYTITLTTQEALMLAENRTNQLLTILWDEVFSIKLSFRDSTMSIPIPCYTTLNEIKSLLEDLPTIGQVRVWIQNISNPDGTSSSSYSYPSGLFVDGNFFSSSSAASSSSSSSSSSSTSLLSDEFFFLCRTDLALIVEFLTDFGDLPLLKLAPNSFVNPLSDTYPLFSVEIQEVLTGDKSMIECSGQGICSEETGVCTCREGFGSSNGISSKIPGETGDCSYISKWV